MNRFIWTFLAGAIGGGCAALLVLSLIGVGGLSGSGPTNDQMQIETRLDNVDARLRSLELNAGTPDTKDQRGITPRP